MKYTQWQVLIAEFCAQLQLPRPQDMLDNGEFVIDGMDAVLVYDGEESGCVTLRFDLGPLPPQAADELLKALMVANFFAGVDGACIWSLRPADGHAVCSYRLALPDDTNAPTLALALQDGARSTRTMWSNTLEVLTGHGAKPRARNQRQGAHYG